MLVKHTNRYGLFNRSVMHLSSHLAGLQGILPAGASAALHMTYNASGLAAGQYIQSITLNSNDPANMTARLQVHSSSAYSVRPKIFFSCHLSVQ